MTKKKILIIGANYTGYGHRSICEALCEQLDKYPDVEYRVVDGFSLIGRAGVNASKIYGPMTRNARDLWKFTYKMSNQAARAMQDMMSPLVYERFLRLLGQFQPGLIVTVHAMFNASLLNILEHCHITIPFVVLQADIINIHRSWCDPRATLTLAPTPEAYACSVNVHHMPPERMEQCGFPTRARFCDAARNAEAPDYTGGRPLNCLLMSGGEGSGNLRRYARQLLEHVDCNVQVICGRNARMKKLLEETLLGEYPGRLTIHGFLDNVQDIMIKSDLVIARGSPNTMMEAVVLGVPLMITGSLPGQEADNPALMISHNLGILCENPESAPAIVTALMSNDGKRLREIRQAQREYRNFDNAKNIAERLHGLALDKVEPIPEPRRIPPAIGIWR